MVNKNNYLTNGFTHPYFGTILGTIAGEKQKTIAGYNVKPANPGQLRKGIWTDGFVTKNIWSNEGDGTILKNSAIISSAIQSDLPLNHTQIINGQEGIQTIIEFLNESTSTNTITRLTADDPQWVTVIVSYPAKNKIIVYQWLVVRPRWRIAAKKSQKGYPQIRNNGYI